MRLSADGTREGGGGRMTMLQPPGSYTVKLSVGGRDYTQPLIVRKDPHWSKAAFPPSCLSAFLPCLSLPASVRLAFIRASS